MPAQRFRTGLVAVTVLAAASWAVAREPKPADAPAKPAPNAADEPAAETMSLAKTAAFLDGVALAWTREKKCGTCHTNYPYLMARPLLKEPSPALAETRTFFEGRVANWDSGKLLDRPRWDTEVVATAVALAVNDAHTTGKLHQRTRQALDRAWTLQKDHGAWNWLKCEWPPMEHDDYYGATYAAIGVGVAPDGYARTEKAKEGLAKLRKYFKANPPPDLHHKAMLLWASTKVDGLMTMPEREAAAKELLAKQRDDGGWSLPSLGDWKRRDGTANDKDAPSDGYATGLVLYVLRQAGVAADEAPMKRGVAWLKGNQRASGRWFTRSLNNDNKGDRGHYITNAGTSFAVLALHACGAAGD